LKDGVEYWLPKGYCCNGASIPYLVQPIAGSAFEPSNEEAAWPHDAGYLTHTFSRSVTDEIMRQLKMQRELAEGASQRIARYRAWKMWFGVRCFGMFAWHNGPKELEELHRIKKMITEREDWEKFRSFWFVSAVV